MRIQEGKNLISFEDVTFFVSLGIIGSLENCLNFQCVYFFQWIFYVWRNVKSWKNQKSSVKWVCVCVFWIAIHYTMDEENRSHKNDSSLCGERFLSIWHGLAREFLYHSIFSVFCHFSFSFLHLWVRDRETERVIMCVCARLCLCICLCKKNVWVWDWVSVCMCVCVWMRVCVSLIGVSLWQENWIY